MGSCNVKDSRDRPSSGAANTDTAVKPSPATTGAGKAPQPQPQKVGEVAPPPPLPFEPGAVVGKPKTEPLLAPSALEGVFSFGDNTHGQLGVEDEGAASAAGPGGLSVCVVEFFRGRSVAQVASGANHVLVLTTEQELFSFGDSCYGQLGHPEKADVRTPRRVEFFAGKRIH
eukprot:RCo029103